MLVDEKGRLFGKVNILDIIFVVLILAVIAAILFIFPAKGNETKTLPITYTLEIKNENEAYFSNVKEGEQVFDGVTKAKLGTIVSFEKKQARVLEQANDKMVLFEPEGYYDGYVTIQADATVSYPDLILDGYPIKIGEEVAFRSESLAMKGFVVEIDYDAEALRRMK